MHTHLSALLLTTVSPLWGHIHPTAVMTLTMVLYVIGMRASAMTFEQLDRAVGLAIRNSLYACGLCDKAAAATMQMDVTHFQKALRGDAFRKIPITNLTLLPWGFWAHFLPALTSIVIRQHVDEMVDVAKEVVNLERKGA